VTDLPCVLQLSWRVRVVLQALAEDVETVVVPAQLAYTQFRALRVRCLPARLPLTHLRVCFFRCRYLDPRKIACPVVVIGARHDRFEFSLTPAFSIMCSIVSCCASQADHPRCH
jgi:hypothetical protein